MRIYLEGKFFEIKTENVDIALVTASLPDCAKQTGLSNEDIGKFFSKITVIIDYNLYNSIKGTLEVTFNLIGMSKDNWTSEY